MIDLTPLDVRKKRGDFGKGLRGYDSQEVDTFLELVAERLEEVVKENMTLRERAERLGEQVATQNGRERAVQDALVTAQELREEIRSSAEREGDLQRREAASEARRVVDDAESRARDMLADAGRALQERQEILAEMERRRARFLTTFRQLLEREMDVVTVEEGRSPLRDVPIDLELQGGRPAREARAEPATDDEAADAPAPGELRLVSTDDPLDRPAPDADIHAMASAVRDPKDSGVPSTPRKGGEDTEGDDGWLDEILDVEAKKPDRGPDEGET